MPLPQAVQKKVDEANAIQQALIAAGVAKGETDEADGDQEGDAVQTEDSADATQQSAAQDGADKTAPKAGEKPQQVFAERVTATEVDVEIETQNPGEDTFEHKYKTLQGMFSSEKRKNAQQESRIDALETMLSQVQAASAVTEQVADAAGDAPAPLSAQEIEDYGPELIAIMKRAAREEVSAEFAALRKENQDLRAVVGNVGQKQQLSERDQFYATLDTALPNWQEVNSDPGFVNWLEEVDVYAGEPRKVLLRRAFDRSDAGRVTRFFDGYLNENAAVQKATTESARPTPTPGKAKVDLASLAAPGAGASGSADTTDESSGRTWKASEIGDFYKAVSKGQYKGREDVKARTEAQIQVALSTGKILVGQ